MARDGHLFTNMTQLKSLRQEKERYGAQSDNKGGIENVPNGNNGQNVNLESL